MKRITIAAVSALLLAVGFYASTSLAGGNPPGRDPCSHGATGKPCRPDPQPGHGKDCDHHGKNGGVNEDHCAGATTTPSTAPAPTQPGKTVTVTTPGSTTPESTTTVNVPTSGPTKTVTRTTKRGVTIIKKIHIITAKHRLPKTTG